MENLVHKENYKGIEILIYQDEDAESPDYWGNEDLFLIYDHRNFYIQRKGFDPQELFDEAWNKGKSVYDGYWMLGVDAYIHSGVSLALRGSARAARFPDRMWDVSFKGFALVKRQKGAWTHKQAVRLANSLLEEWNDFLSGNVYGYDIPDLGNSCWGFYGDYDNKDYSALSEAKSIVDYHLEHKNEKIPVS